VCLTPDTLPHPRSAPLQGPTLSLRSVGGSGVLPQSRASFR
jgi:hypothetical protein